MRLTCSPEFDIKDVTTQNQSRKRLEEREAAMSSTTSDDQGAVLVQATEAETLGSDATLIVSTLLADSDTTGGTLAAIRVTLQKDANGAPPHYHTQSAELLYMLSGSLEALAGEEVVKLEAGDLLVVPQKMPHAFTTAPGAAADLLIVFAPGIPRFDYFRLIDKVSKGEADPQKMAETQEQYDNHFVDSPVWREARGWG
jgi:quercetin dioxygenase-like cupin family protein